MCGVCVGEWVCGVCVGEWVGGVCLCGCGCVNIDVKLLCCHSYISMYFHDMCLYIVMQIYSY